MMRVYEYKCNHIGCKNVVESRTAISQGWQKIDEPPVAQGFGGRLLTYAQIRQKAHDL